MSKTYFISGHLDLTQDEFDEHYAPKIDAAVAEGAYFVVGDARGTDTMAQVYLSAAERYPKIGNYIRCLAVVYHMHRFPRPSVGITEHTFPTRGGYVNDKERDSAMTRDSDSDIAWVRPGREKSGTAKNLYRRNQ